MAAVLHSLDQRRLIDSNGIADGASIYFYTTGTLTPAAVYTTAALSVAHPSPIEVAAGAAVPDIYLDEDVTYRRRIVYPDGSVDDTDPYTAGAVLATTFTAAKYWVTPEMFGAVGDGVTNDRAAFASAIADGAGILTQRGKTYLISTALTGTDAVHIAGLGTIVATADLFQVDADITLEGVTVQAANGFVIAGSNSAGSTTYVTGLRNYTLRNATFDGCSRVVNFRTSGTSAFTSGVGIDRLVCEGCRFTDGTNIAFHIETNLTSALWQGNYWENQSIACVWIGAQTEVRQAAMDNIQILGNTVKGVISTADSDTATTAFQVQAERVNISDNTIVGIVCSHTGPEAWGFYTKATDHVASGNIIVGVTGSTVNNIFIAFKGDAVGGGNPVGTRAVASDNIFINTADAASIGYHLYGDRIKVGRTIMSGVGTPIDSDITDVTTRFEIDDVTATDPPASSKAYGFDLGFNGAEVYIRNCTVKGYTNDIRIKIGATAIPRFEALDNTLSCTDAAFRFDMTASASITKTVIRGGSAAGAYLCRHDDATATPDLVIDRVDVASLTTGLFVGAHTWQDGALRVTVPKTTTTGTGTMLTVATINPAEGTIMQLTYGAVGMLAAGTSLLSFKYMDTYSRATGASPAKLGSTTSIHVPGGIGALDTSVSSNSVLVRIGGAAATTIKNRVTIEAEFSKASA